LRDEINLVAKVISRKKPVIGFCLGTQLIAEALGAQTCRSPEKEVGVFPVQLTLAGTKDPILRGFPAEFDVLHWHHDMPGIPDGAVLLARSAGCPHQAFRFGDRVYGFQFHMEPTAESIKPLLQNGESDLAPSRYTQTAEAILSSDFGSMNARLAQVMDALAAFAPRRKEIR
jgi:GMP synthase (glutamine-hydrolysing)